MILLILSFLVLLVPAYLLTRIFFRIKLLMSLAISIGLAIFISIISGFLLNFVSINALNLWIFYLVISIVLGLIVYFRKVKLFPKFEIDNKELIILLIALVLASVFVYIPRFDYKFPNHVDEWNHLSFANEIIENGELFNSPYYNGKEYHLETGTHIFLSEIFLLFNIDPVLNYRFLPILFMFLTSLILFVSLFTLTKKFWVGIFGILFLVALKSNANILGIWLFTPFSMGFPLVFLFLFLFIIAIRNDRIKYLILSIILLLTLIMFHASTAIMLGLVAFVYLLFNFRFIKKHYIILFGSLVVLVLVGLIFSKFMLNRNLNSVISIILNYRFPTGASFSYNYLSIYGIIASILAFIGLLIAIKSKKLRIYSLFWIIMFGYYFMSYFISHTYYIEYLRVFYLLMISSVVLASFGGYYVIKSLLDSVNRKDMKIVILVVVFFILFAFQFSQYRILDLNDTRDIRNKWHRYIDEDDYSTLTWLKKSEIKNEKIFSMPRVGNTLPLTGNYPGARIRLVHGFPEEVTDSKKFFNRNTGCDERGKILQKYKSDYVYSRELLKCDFLELKYRDENYIYVVLKERFK